MKRVFAMIACIIFPLLAVAKDRPTLQLEVIGTDAWQRDLAIHHAATAGRSDTNCDTNGNVNSTTYGNITSGSVNATTNCSTSTTPGYTTHRAI